MDDTQMNIYLGVAKNTAGETIISTEYSSVLCLRIPTNEEGMIAAHTLALANLSTPMMSS